MFDWNKDLNHLYNEKLIFGDDKVSSEHSEELIIKSVFSHIKPKNKWCVDVGAYGIKSSNTYGLIKDGWKSVQIETDPDQVRFLKNFYKKNLDVEVMDRFITPKNLDSVLSERTSLPKSFDFLSIDIDSYDYEVWMNLKSYSPNLVCIECDQHETDFSVVSYDPSYSLHTEHGGASVGLLNRVAKEKGYTYLCLTGNNVFYIKNSFLKT
jgi:hypothetical protein